MNLKEFVKNVLIEVNEAVDEAGQETAREIRFSDKENSRTMEFDIAVSADSSSSISGKGGVRVLSVVEGGGELTKADKKSTVSRVVFGLQIAHFTKQEESANISAVEAHNNSLPKMWQD